MAYSGAYGGRNQASEAADRSPEGDRLRHVERKSSSSNSPGSRPSLNLGALFSKTEAVGMETDDLLMALILYLMYRESGDTDLLIMLGVMLLT